MGRSFGVEFEFGTYLQEDEDDYYAYYRVMNDAMKREGFLDAGWEVGEDGTQFEITTPILSGANGFKEIKKFLAFLQQFDPYVTTQDGLHVHHDAPEFVDNPEMIERLVMSWMLNQDEIKKMVSRSRHRNYACPLWDYEQLEAARRYMKDGYFHTSGRKALNISALEEHGSIEIRLHQGTLDFDEIVSWVRFGQKFIDGVSKRKTPLGRAEDIEDLLKKVKVAKNSSRFLVIKAQNNGELVRGL